MKFILRNKIITTAFSFFLLILTLLISFTASPSQGASCGNFNDFFTDRENFKGFFFQVEGDVQENTFDTQRDRNAEPGSDGTERHYSEIRSSKTETLYTGVKIGAALNHFPLVYLTAGYAETDVDFSFKDENTDKFRTYSKQVSFESDYYLTLGAGVAAKIFEKEVFTDKILKAGLDLQYRYYDFDADNHVNSDRTGSYTMEYAAELHEVQLAIACALSDLSWQPFSAVTLLFTPYTGFKISYITGDETYEDPGNVYGSTSVFYHDPVSYSGDIDHSNHVSWFAGTSVQIRDNVKINLETRSGDEDGYTLSFTYQF